MIITSEASKQLIMLQLTMHWEECIKEANDRKLVKYQELVEECKGWNTLFEPIEFSSVLTQLGITGGCRKAEGNPS